MALFDSLTESVAHTSAGLARGWRLTFAGPVAIIFGYASIRLLEHHGTRARKRY